MNRFDAVFEKLGRPVLVDSEDLRVVLVSTDDAANAGISEIREFAAALAEDSEPNTSTAGHAATADVEVRGCTW